MLDLPFTACILVIILSSSNTCLSPSPSPPFLSFCSSPAREGSSRRAAPSSSSIESSPTPNRRSESPLEPSKSMSSSAAAVGAHSFASRASKRRERPVFPGKRVLAPLYLCFNTERNIPLLKLGLSKIKVMFIGSPLAVLGGCPIKRRVCVYIPPKSLLPPFPSSPLTSPSTHSQPPHSLHRSSHSSVETSARGDTGWWTPTARRTGSGAREYGVVFCSRSLEIVERTRRMCDRVCVRE